MILEDFEQIKRFDSFEPGTMEHAVYGAQLLFTGENDPQICEG